MYAFLRKDPKKIKVTIAKCLVLFRSCIILGLICIKKFYRHQNIEVMTYKCVVPFNLCDILLWIFILKFYHAILIFIIIIIIIIVSIVVINITIFVNTDEVMENVISKIGKQRDFTILYTGKKPSVVRSFLLQPE